MTDSAARKAAMRRLIMAARDALPPEARAAASQVLAERATGADFRAMLPAPGGTISGYLPIRSEIDPQPLMRYLRGEGYRLALPRITPEGLAFHLWEAGTLAAGPFGTREPPPDWPPAVPDLFLVPLLAFDAAGQRLGYGRAYYDRAFAAFPAARRVGLAFGMQEVAEVPIEPHDARLDLVLTAG